MSYHSRYSFSEHTFHNEIINIVEHMQSPQIGFKSHCLYHLLIGIRYITCHYECDQHAIPRIRYNIYFFFADTEI